MWLCDGVISWKGNTDADELNLVTVRTIVCVHDSIYTGNRPGVHLCFVVVSRILLHPVSISRPKPDTLKEGRR